MQRLWVQIPTDIQKCPAGTFPCSAVGVLEGRDSPFVAASHAWRRTGIYLHLLNWMEHSDELDLQDEPSVQGHQRTMSQSVPPPIPGRFVEQRAKVRMNTVSPRTPRGEGNKCFWGHALNLVI